MEATCLKCKGKGIWEYGPTGELYCDEHAFRCKYCSIDENGTVMQDEWGRFLVCEDYIYVGDNE